MNFFERQAAARKASRRLIALFALAVLGIVLAVNFVLLVALGMLGEQQVAAHGGLGPYLQANAGMILTVTLGTAAVIGVASLVRMGSLRSGGSAVALSLGGVQVAEDTTDPQLRRLRNVVEEIAIASAVPVPAIFVLEEEQAINAFAAGYSPSDAAIAVTRGALERLNRDELQGVVAHEFSHVLNGDMRLNIQLMGVLFGILVLAIAGRRILWHTRGGRSRDAAAIVAIALALTVIGYVGVFFGRMIKAGVSRSREMLADASAVQFTRQTAGIAGALKKIAGLEEGSRLVAADTEEVSHMLFGEGVGLSSMMSTHPPILERIRALEPGFDPKALGELKTRWSRKPPSGLAEDRAMGLVEGVQLAAAATASLPAGATEVALAPARVAAHTGQPERNDYAQAGRLREAIPPALLDAAHGHDDAVALVLALLLDADQALRTRQLGEVAERVGDEPARRSAALFEQLQGLHPLLRLPLAALAFPALRRRPRAQLDRLVATCDTLIHIDGKVGLFEYCLGRMLQRQVIEALDPSRHRLSGRRKLAHSRQALAELFAVLAAHGHEDDDEARHAFSAGLRAVLPGAAFEYRPPADWVAALDRALDELDRLEPLGKELLVEGLSATSSHDGRITVAEAELLRTICACLHCPLPPLLGPEG
jgi:Zn-dependent protease with chaperone function